MFHKLHQRLLDDAVATSDTQFQNHKAFAHIKTLMKFLDLIMNSMEKSQSFYKIKNSKRNIVTVLMLDGNLKSLNLNLKRNTQKIEQLH